MKVLITRQLGDVKNSVEVDIQELHDPKWDHVGGGIQKSHKKPHLYAKISYARGLELGVRCSGRHDFGYNEMKVLVIEPKTKKDEYYPGYQKLAEQADRKKERKYIKSHRNKSCKQAIFDVLEQLNGANISRKELYEKVEEQLYEANGEVNQNRRSFTSNINRNLRELSDDRIITMDGSNQSKDQKISLSKPE